MALLYALESERLRAGTVSGTVDADYVDDWLLDGRFDRPIKRTGALSITYTPSETKQVQVFALMNHLVEAGVSVTIKQNGTLRATITPGTWPAGGIPLNAYTNLSSALTFSSGDTILVESTGNVNPYVVGELWMSSVHDLGTDFVQGRGRNPGRPYSWRSALPPSDDGLSNPRTMRGDMILTDAQFSALESWYEATKRGTLPSLIIPDSTVNDAWYAQFSYEERHQEGFHFVVVEITEIQRTAW